MWSDLVPTIPHPADRAGDGAGGVAEIMSLGINDQDGPSGVTSTNEQRCRVGARRVTSAARFLTPLYSGFRLGEKTYHFSVVGRDKAPGRSRRDHLGRKRSAYSGLPSFSLHSSANRCISQRPPSASLLQNLFYQSLMFRGAD
jgi:hypothetical protein